MTYTCSFMQSGEALELLTNLKESSVSLVFFDPQYEPVKNVLAVNYPLYSQINKTLLGNDRIPLWLLKTPTLKIVDFLLFKNRSFGNVWEENVVPVSKRKHPHQKPRELIKALIEATTEKGDLIVDPCAGSFVVLEVCQELKREFCGVDLTFKELKEFLEKR
ncbi:15122_t:CDS:2 [Funneliformis geosporum]|nr:15122_t:CDS:2 [Funneliformis geosporum]